MARVLVVSDHDPDLHVELVLPDGGDETIRCRCSGGCDLRDDDDTADAVNNAIVHIDHQH